MAGFRAVRTAAAHSGTVRDVAGAVLAAGAGARMGTPKGELAVHGVRLVDRAVAAMRAGGCDPVLAVVRAGTAVPGARTLVNPDPARGLRSSLALAVDAAADAAALAVLLADLPGVAGDAVSAVASAWRPGRIAVARLNGRRAHPTVMAPDLWRAALAAAGPDEGARALLADRPDLVDEIDVAGDPTDLDTPADLARWRDLHAGPP
jgi:CTP:molybdopterin cytidylyltransferase MocA